MSERPLTLKERIYVDSRLSGMTQVASAAAGGFADPKKSASAIDKRPAVQREMVQRMQKTAEEVNFSRKEAHNMLMTAYVSAATAAEQIMAVNAMIKLHGIAEPIKVEHKHTHGGTVMLEQMELDQLLKLAGMEHLTLEGEFEVVRDAQLIEHKDENERKVPK